MSIRSATLSSAFIGRSAKTAPVPWFANRNDFQVNLANQVEFVASTANASANTVGAWTQIIASTTGDIGLVYCRLAGTVGATDSSYMFDLATGASGNESSNIFASNIACGNTEFSACWPIVFPVFIPSGSRVSVRLRTGVGGRQMFSSFSFAQTRDMHLTPRSVDTIGAVPSTSRGTALSGASGLWTEITPATSQPYQAFAISVSNGQTTGTNQQIRLTLGYGPAGSEVPIGMHAYGQGSTGTFASNNLSGLYPPPIIGFPLPAGQRLAIRHNITANPDRVQVCVIGVPFR